MKSFAVVLLLLLTIAREADGAIMDFESLRIDDGALHDQPGMVTFEGFTILSVPPEGNAFRYVTAGTLHPLFAGSTGLFNGQSNAENILTAANGGAFALHSIDLAAIAPGASDPNGLTDPGPFDLTFTGTNVDGSIVVNAFTINNTFLSFETFTFTGFDNVIAVSWFQGAGFNPPGPPLPGQASHQFDNIEVEAVPEPTTSLMWMGGLLSVLLVGRRFRTQMRVN